VEACSAFERVEIAETCHPRRQPGRLVLTFSEYTTMARKTVYLSGPIMDASGGEALVWRESAKELLSPYFRLLDPMRRNFQDRLVDSANEIVEFDLQDIRDADIILVNYCKPSIGTSMEVFYAAHNQGKFIVTFSPFSFQECSPWMVRYSTKILPDLDAACDYVLTHFNEHESQ